ncbi:unnamed protein product [Moneuplotes crassus]|uniref:Cyclic nucleotide-binding domain-containing protein n=1 Tax=Euplotes crassus TaxID=5936 RepID=A0AAD1U2N6_EUPCR|nr:unnamed protein product [Moneuplotes crassus]
MKASSSPGSPKPSTPDLEEAKSVLESDISSSVTIPTLQPASQKQSASKNRSSKFTPNLKEEALQEKNKTSTFTKTTQKIREKEIIFKCIKNFLKKNDLEEVFEKAQEEEKPQQEQEDQAPEENNLAQEGRGESKEALGYEMIYKSMLFEGLKKNDFVMKFGELGTKFYIVLKGKVSVRVPSIIEKDFTFKELLTLLDKNYEWVIENEKYQEVLELVQGMIPELVSEDYKRNLKLNIDSLKKVMKGKIISEIQHNYSDGIPKFEDFADVIRERTFVKKGKNNNTRYITCNFILEVVQLDVGASFGELALLEDKPRAATILCTENTRFAILEKEHFNKVMGKMYRKKFAKDIDFLSNFAFLHGLTRITKQKICYPMTSREFVRGQILVSEGDQVEDIILLEEGEYEMTKNIYVKDTKVVCEFLRIQCDKDQAFIESLLDPDSKPYTFAVDPVNKEMFHKRMKIFKKLKIKISNNQRYESIGLIESVFDSVTLPGCYFTTVKCISKSGKARVIEKEELFRVVSRTKPEVLHTVRQKLSFIAQRMKFLLKCNEIELRPSYFKSGGLSLSFRNPFSMAISSPTKKIDSDGEGAEGDKFSIKNYKELMHGEKTSLASAKRRVSQMKLFKTFETQEVEEFLNHIRKKRMSVIADASMIRGLKMPSKDLITQLNTKRNALKNSSIIDFEFLKAADEPLKKGITPISDTQEEDSLTESEESGSSNNYTEEMDSKYEQSNHSHSVSIEKSPLGKKHEMNSPKVTKNTKNIQTSNFSKDVSSLSSPRDINLPEVSSPSFKIEPQNVSPSAEQKDSRRGEILRKSKKPSKIISPKKEDFLSALPSVLQSKIQLETSRNKKADKLIKKLFSHEDPGNNLPQIPLRTSKIGTQNDRFKSYNKNRWGRIPLEKPQRKNVYMIKKPLNPLRKSMKNSLQNIDGMITEGMSKSKNALKSFRSPNKSLKKKLKLIKSVETLGQNPFQEDDYETSGLKSPDFVLRMELPALAKHKSSLLDKKKNTLKEIICTKIRNQYRKEDPQGSKQGAKQPKEWRKHLKERSSVKKQPGLRECP